MYDLDRTCFPSIYLSWVKPTSTDIICVWWSRISNIEFDSIKCSDVVLHICGIILQDESYSQPWSIWSLGWQVWAASDIFYDVPRTGKHKTCHWGNEGFHTTHISDLRTTYALLMYLIPSIVHFTQILAKVTVIFMYLMVFIYVTDNVACCVCPWHRTRDRWQPTVHDGYGRYPPRRPLSQTG